MYRSFTGEYFVKAVVYGNAHDVDERESMRQRIVCVGFDCYKMKSASVGIHMKIENVSKIKIRANVLADFRQLGVECATAALNQSPSCT